MDEYLKIMEEDYSLLGNVILQSRGNMALDKFAMKCGYSPRVFQGYIRNEKTKKYNDWRGVKRLADALADNGDPASGITKKRGFSLDEITKIVESQRSSGNVTKDSMIAVNGMVPYDNLVKIVQAIKPEKTDKKDFRRKEFAPPENVHCPYYPDDQKRFLEDITYLSAYLSSDDILFFKENIARIFKDKALVKMIYKFKMHREQEMKNLTAAISTTEEIDTTLSGYYMDMILEMVRKEEKPDDVAVENKKSIKTISDEKSLKPIGKKKPQKAVSDNKCSWFMTPDMSVFDKA